MNTLHKFGFDNSYILHIQQNKLDDFTIGRVVNQQKERYLVQTETGIFPAEITGNLRFSANSTADFPVIGDWVLLIGYDELFLIQSILPRKTILERKSIDAEAETQVIAANIDVALIVQSLDHDFNINRIDRYITIAYGGNIHPVIVLNKTDLLTVDELNSKILAIKVRHEKIEIIVANTVTENGLDELKEILEAGKTFCFLGSSGVGKSSIINALLGHTLLKTREISNSTSKGKHTTTHREMIVLENGSLVIDTPGMRELGIASSGDGLEQTFDRIFELSQLCKFPDCSHSSEPGCAVQMAIEQGELDAQAFGNFMKLQRESNRFNISKAEKRKKDKEFGKMAREVMKVKKKTKF